MPEMAEARLVQRTVPAAGTAVLAIGHRCAGERDEQAAPAPCRLTHFYPSHTESG